MRTVLIAMLSVGCLKPKPPVQAPQSEPVVVAVVLESFDDDTAPEVPSDALERVTEEVSGRNLQPVRADSAAIAAVRSTDARLDALEQAGETVLLVEAAPRFSAQVNGRYRWSVETTVTLSAGERRSEAVSVPVHLVYSHEEEAEALSEAVPVVARHVGRVLDDWIASEAR